jgi:hypothetical protein
MWRTPLFILSRSIVAIHRMKVDAGILAADGKHHLLPHSSRAENGSAGVHAAMHMQVRVNRELL